jgi:DNA-binding CsgD family transcriptional regulator
VHAITLEPEPNRSLQIRFFRLTLGGRTDGQQRYLAGAVMFDPHRDTQPSQQIIQELYGLTNVEAEVVIALSGGLSISEASDKLHISIFTARGYLKSIFRKTGACRQSDLVRLATAASGIE